MKPFLFLLAFSAFGMLPATAQETVKVDAKDLKTAGVETPQFQATNVGDKRWRPKTWLELDLEFDVKLAQALGGRNGSLESITVNYYVAFSEKTSDGKTQYIKGTFNYSDIPASETCHALAFVSPATLRRILKRDNFTASSDVQGWGYEISVDGKVVKGGTSTGTTKWWESPSVVAIEGALLAKKDTPFSVLWGDYDVNVKK
ncbi:MAG: Amuc_1102 family pilus-like protein [Prosthecobacter sp.]|nr:Amuc_1102 family pilus-like protein [Prosthecobacter sp.]